MRRSFVLAQEIRHQVDAIDVARCLNARQGASARKNIQGDDGMIVSLARGQLARPGDEQRHTNAAFERLSLVASQGPVDARVVRQERRETGAAIVADEDDERVLIGPGLL